MDAMLSRLGQIAARGGALAMLSALAAYTVSRDPIALLAFAAAVSAMQLLCLVEGPWTAPLLQRLAVGARTERRG
jgi:hypothetical protein